MDGPNVYWWQIVPDSGWKMVVSSWKGVDNDGDVDHGGDWGNGGETYIDKMDNGGEDIANDGGRVGLATIVIVAIETMEARAVTVVVVVMEAMATMATMVAMRTLVWIEHWPQERGALFGEGTLGRNGLYNQYSKQGDDLLKGQKDIHRAIWNSTDYPGFRQMGGEYHFDIKLKPEILPSWNREPDTLAVWLLEDNDLSEKGATLYTEWGNIVLKKLRDMAHKWFWSLLFDYRRDA